MKVTNISLELAKPARFKTAENGVVGGADIEFADGCAIHVDIEFYNGKLYTGDIIATNEKTEKNDPIGYGANATNFLWDYLADCGYKNILAGAPVCPPMITAGDFEEYFTSRK
jgi:hypothetical protein